jgi:trehalose 6-phosphate synthase/phosphatase
MAGPLGERSRLLLVSNRLPVTVRIDAKRVTVAASSGGLATGLKGPHERSAGLWIGWPGDVSKTTPDQLKTIEKALGELRAVPVHLTSGEVARYYESFSNGVLWPLFHYLSDRIPVDTHDWDTYRRVNEKFADAVAKEHRPGDTVWVHDYQLLLVPGLLRARIPDAKIGFFLHIPFPATDVFRILPWRTEILEGMLGADLIGFHTFGYMRHFAKSIVRTLGVVFDIDRVPYKGRVVHLGAYPMGVDAADFARLAGTEDVIAQVNGIREASQDQKVLLAVDRLDYTKGIQRRLVAFERLLEREPKLRGKIRFIQVAVPSREKVEAYAQFRSKVEEAVGRINGAYGSVTQVPIHYMYRSFSAGQVAALYRAADVMLVTPLRDGMNLVAKEFVATRTDGDGVLVLSEFAGAFSELGEALSVNPYDIAGMAAAFKRALSMPEAERRTRMAALRARVSRHDVHHWADTFIDKLEDLPRSAGTLDSWTAPDALAALVERIRRAPDVALLLDYDGTLRGFVSSPELATPPEALTELLLALSRKPGVEVCIVSGRTRESLESLVGALPIALCAEHGAWFRSAGGSWAALREVVPAWKESVRHILEEFTDRTPGSRIEEKSSTIAWHYRTADEEFGPMQARELAVHLIDLLTNTPVEVIQGDMVVEIRQQGIQKGLAVEKVLRDRTRTNRHLPLFVALGDDRTDEDLFAALPEDAIALHVGPSPSRAPHRLADVPSALAFLGALLDSGSA